MSVLSVAVFERNLRCRLTPGIKRMADAPAYAQKR